MPTFRDPTLLECGNDLEREAGLFDEAYEVYKARGVVLKARRASRLEQLSEMYTIKEKALPISWTCKQKQLCITE